MRRSGGHLICLVLAMVLLMPWLVGSSGARLENRTLAGFPRPDLGSVLDPSTYRQTDTALKDRLGLREHVIGHAGRSGLDQLGVSLTGQVHVGTGRQLFLTKDFTEPCPYADRFDATAVKDRIDGWASLAAQHGKQLIVAIPPDKSSVYRSRLGPQGDALMACSDRIRTAIRQAWGPAGDRTTVLLWDDLKAIERRHPDTTYQPGDAHWTPVAAGRLVERLVQLAGRTTVPTGGELRPGDTWNRRGDLYALLGFSRSDPVPTLEVRRAGVRTEKSVTGTPSKRGLRRYRSTSSDAPLIAGRTLVIHDSFGNPLESLLTPYFRDVTFLHWSDLVPVAKAGQAEPGYDRIIVEAVERGFARHTATTFADPVVDKAIRHWLRR